MNQNNKENKLEVEFEIEDLSIDDANIKLDVKMDTETKNIDTRSNNVSSNSNDMTDVSSDPNDMTDVTNDLSDVDNLNEPLNNSSFDDDFSSNPDALEQQPNDINEGLTEKDENEDKRSLKEKAQDTKENLREKADKIRNAPENIKNKYNEAKDKAKDIKDKAKQVPENLKNKKDQVKNAWNNRPKSMKDAKDRMRNKGSNLKDRMKNGAKNRAKNMANKAKEGAKESFKNSDLGQGIDKAKNAIDKSKKVAKGAKKAGKAVAKAGKAAGKAAAKAAQGLLNLFISTLPWSAIVLGIVLVIALIIVLVCAFVPGIGGDVNDEDNYSQYSKTDQKTLEKLEDIFTKYPNADGTLAMSVVLYPYFDNLHSGNVTSSLVEYTENSESEDDEEKQEELDEEDVEQEEDTTDDDPYLYPLRKRKVRNRLKKVLEELNGSKESDFKDYLKNEYFQKDGGYTWGYNEEVLTGYNGYKNLLKAAGSNNGDELYNLIIDDIYDNKNLFIDYVFKNAVCASTLVDAGNIETSDLLKSTIYVDLKKPGCSNLSQCSESYYSNYLTLEEYVKGVVYEEIGGNTDLNQITAQMVAAKTYTLSRRTGSIKQDAATGAYVIPMLWSTADQDFCHVELGCNADDIKSHYGYNTNGDSRLIHGANREPASESQRSLYNQAWEMSKDVYVVDDSGAAAKVAYYVGCPSNGKCMDQDKLPNYTNVDYKSILSSFYSSYAIATVEGNVSNIQTAGSLVCTNSDTNMSSKRAKIVSFALEQVDKIPYYEGGLASVSGYDGNGFNTDVEPDIDGRTKKGLGNIGFLNWVYWTNIEENFGNINSADNILSNSYEIEQKNLLMGDIGYSSDKSVFAIYVGENKWVFEDSVSGNVISRPDDRFTKFIRLNSFKSETYNYTMRTKKPTVSEWSGNNMLPIGSTDYLGECPWYARNRAYEIIRELYGNGSLTKEQYKRFYNRLDRTSGNGGDFYPGNSSADQGYPGSTNIDDVKAGAFMGMTSGSKYGHVAVIEYANPEEDKIIVTDGWARGNYCTYSNYSCISFNYQEYTYQQFKNNFSGRFKGFLYFLEE